MALCNQSSSRNKDMVLLTNQSPVSHMNSLLLANEMTSSMSLSSFNCSGNQQNKKSNKNNNFVASTLRATALFKSFPVGHRTPPAYPYVGRMGSRILRASYNFPLKIKYKFGAPGGFTVGHLSNPHGFCLGPEDDIVVADTKNHRIQVFGKDGIFKYKFGLPGLDDGFLWLPRKVVHLTHSNGYYVVGDKGPERSRLQLFTRFGFFVRRIPTPYIEILAGLAVTPDARIVAVDSVEPTVFILNLNGTVLHFFDCRRTLLEPSELAVRGSEIFICDFKAHSVFVFSDRGRFLRRFGGPHLTNFPNGIDISPEGYVLVGDSHGNHFHLVAFSLAGDLLVEFECSSLRVSRCCGLKITSEGLVVTAAKNNHHMIVTENLKEVRDV